MPSLLSISGKISQQRSREAQEAHWQDSDHIERRSVVCQGEANASRSVRWRCVTEVSPRVEEVEMPASESRHVAEHQIGLRACGGTAEGDDLGPVR